MKKRKVVIKRTKEARKKKEVKEIEKINYSLSIREDVINYLLL